MCDCGFRPAIICPPRCARDAAIWRAAAAAGWAAHSAGAAQRLRHGGAGRPGDDGHRVFVFARQRRSLFSSAAVSDSRGGRRWHGRCARASPASARFAAAALLRTIGRTTSKDPRDGGSADRRRMAAHRRPGDAQSAGHDPAGGAHEGSDQVGRVLGVCARAGRGDAAHPAVARVAAFGLPHKEKGEIPAAAVELQRRRAWRRRRICWNGAGRIWRPTRRRAASGLWKPAGCRRTTTERFCAVYCASGSQILSTDPDLSRGAGLRMGRAAHRAMQEKLRQSNRPKLQCRAPRQGVGAGKTRRQCSQFAEVRPAG